MILTLDVGNTNIVAGIFKGKEIADSWRLTTDPKKTIDEWVIQLALLFNTHKIDPKAIKGAIIGSVVPRIPNLLTEAIKFFGDIDVMIIDGGTPLPLRNLYDNPWEVGVDRLANAVGGKVRYGAPLIIVDFGTATTLDVVSKEGDYLGGSIMPGPETAADSLFSKTAQLPRIFLDEPKSVLGKNTTQSIKSGLIYGLGGAADVLIERIWEELGYSTDVVATGGLAPMISKFAKKIFKTDNNLTLLGLKIIWDYNND